MIFHWFLHYTGSDNPAGPWYGFWSGFVAGVLAAARHKNCAVKGCWRLGHTDPEHGHPACRKHHSQAHKL